MTKKVWYWKRARWEAKLHTNSLFSGYNEFMKETLPAARKRDEGEYLTINLSSKARHFFYNYIEEYV